MLASLHQIDTNHNDENVTFSSDPATRLVSIKLPSQVALYETTTGKPISLTKEIRQIYFGDSLYVVGYEDSAEIRSVNDDALMKKLKGPISHVTFGWHPLQMLITYQDLSVELISAKTGKLVTSLEKMEVNQDQGASCSFVGDLQRILCTGPDGKARLISSQEGKIIATLPAPVLDSLIFNVGAEYAFILLDYEGLPAEIRNLVNGSVVTTLSDEVFHDSYGRSYVMRGNVQDRYASEDDTKYFIVRYKTKPSELRAAPDGKLITVLNGSAEVYPGVSFDNLTSPTLMFIQYADGRSEVWQVKGQVQLLSDLGTGLQNGASEFFDPMGRRLVAGYSDGRVYILDVDWLRQVATLGADTPSATLLKAACEGPLAPKRFNMDELRPFLDGAPPVACAPTSKP